MSLSEPVSPAAARGPRTVRTLNQGLSATDFKLAFRNHAAGVAVVTADDGNGPVGLTATSVFSVSAEPPLFVFSVSEHSSATPVIKRADTVVVHLLGADQLNIARLCSTSGIDRFADTSLWERLPSGEPYFPSSPAWIHGRVINQLEAGGSTLIVVHALGAKTPDNDDETESIRPLVYYNRTWHALGDPSAIPTS